MKIEPVADTDLPGLLGIFNSAREKNGSFSRLAFSLDEFMAVIEGEHLLVARLADDLAGFAAIWKPDNFLHHLFVAPQYQRKGVGKALVLECIRTFGLPMSLKCIKANTAACHFYERLGWQAREEGTGPEGPYIHYYRDDNVWQTREAKAPAA